MDSNACAGVVTTTLDFAPQLRDEPGIKAMMPDRLKLRNGTELLAHWADLFARSRT
jgi:hypothetical protein